MCIRVASCCGASLRTGVVVVGVITVAQTIVMIVMGGYYLYEGFKVGDYSQTVNWRLPYRFDVIRAFGAVYLAFGAIWMIICMIYAAALYTERAMYFLPWLVFQAVTIGLALTNAISNAAYKYYDGLYIIPVCIFALLIYPVVFSYYSELQDEKNYGSARDLRTRIRKY